MKIASPPKLVILGPVPPPIAGRSVVTGQFVKELKQAQTAFRLVNLAVPWTSGLFRRRWRRALYLMLRAGQLLRRTRHATTTYIAVDANPGTIFTVLYALIARVNRTRIVLHHHSYSYVSAPTLAMRWLSGVAGGHALHVTPCAKMSAEMSARYACIERTAVLSNAFAIDPGLSEVRRPADCPRLVLGHLSNLNATKGTLTAIECFTELHRQGQPVDLHLAGPIQEERIARSVRNAADEFGHAFRYHGPVDGAAKRAFYAGIDVFLFPTVFRNEVQPLVVLEALAAGCPVIAFGRACIPPLLQGGAGLVVPCDHDFKAVAAGQILAWHRDRDALQSTGDAARRRFAELRERSTEELCAMLEYLARSRPLQRSGEPFAIVCSVASEPEPLCRMGSSSAERPLDRDKCIL